MKVHELMTTPVSTCTTDTNLAAAAMTMWQADCGALPVVADNGKVVGMITDRDICMASATQHCDVAELPVGMVISGSVKSCRPEDDINDVLRMMEHEKVRRLPVIDANQELQGLVSINDLILHAEKKERGRKPSVSEEEVMRTLKGISAHWLPAISNGRSNRPPTRSKRTQREAGGGRVSAKQR